MARLITFQPWGCHVLVTLHACESFLWLSSIATPPARKSRWLSFFFVCFVGESTKPNYPCDAGKYFRFSQWFNMLCTFNFTKRTSWLRNHNLWLFLGFQKQMTSKTFGKMAFMEQDGRCFVVNKGDCRLTRVFDPRQALIPVLCLLKLLTPFSNRNLTHKELKTRSWTLLC